MAQNPKETTVPGLIGGFNIPKAVIENKVDVLTFLEILVRKNIITSQELDEVRGAVVAHLNAAYPELDLSYTTPGGAPTNQAPQMPSGTRPNSIAAQSMMAPATATATPPPAAVNPVASTGASTAIPSGTPTDLPPQQPMQVEHSKPPTASEGSVLSEYVDEKAHDKPLYYSAPPPKFIK